METDAAKIKTEPTFAREELPYVLLERAEQKDFFSCVESFMVVASGPRRRTVEGRETELSLIVTYCIHFYNT